ncbi:flavodoxin domain-containing protein [Bacillota bacterium LX-D]|nr:flavodoxin domain-containing protein [Bacillota bacterium LX-D]
MPAVQILENIYWVGAVDWNLRYFHGPTLSAHKGTSYNAYLVMDEKIALFDTVYKPFTEDFISNIKAVVDPAEIDYIIVNHIEPDHSGAFPTMLKLCPKAKIFCTQKAMEGLIKLYNVTADFNIVKSGDELALGKRTIKFLEAPMLHWPDSMFSYLEQDELLISNDAFGQHLASSALFDDQVNEGELMEEAAKYYANILGPFSPLVLKKLEEVQKMHLKIKMIAPSHGVIWRSNPNKIIEAYLKWAKGESQNKAIIVYDTMWESTEKMAKAILRGLASQDVAVRLYKASISDSNDIMTQVWDAKALLVGSSTINNGFLPVLAPFLEEVKALKPRNKIGVAFGSYGWGGGAVKSVAEYLTAGGIKIAAENMQIKWAPSDEELAKCYALGQELGKKIREME